jgi:hypothetical protein
MALLVFKDKRDTEKKVAFRRSVLKWRKLFWISFSANILLIILELAHCISQRLSTRSF